MRKHFVPEFANFSYAGIFVILDAMEHKTIIKFSTNGAYLSIMVTLGERAQFLCDIDEKGEQGEAK